VWCWGFSLFNLTHYFVWYVSGKYKCTVATLNNALCNFIVFMESLPCTLFVEPRLLVYGTTDHYTIAAWYNQSLNHHIDEDYMFTVCALSTKSVS